MKHQKLKTIMMPIIVLVIIILPIFIYRIYNEQKSKVYGVAINLNELFDEYKTTNIETQVIDYKNSGVTNVIIEERNGRYSEELLKLAKELELNIILMPDLLNESDANILSIIDRFNVKYVKIDLKTTTGLKHKNKSKLIYPIIDKKRDNNSYHQDYILNFINKYDIKYIDYLRKTNKLVISKFNSKNDKKNIKLLYPIRNNKQNYFSSDKYYISNFTNKYYIKSIHRTNEVSLKESEVYIKSRILYKTIEKKQLNIILTEDAMLYSNIHPYNYLKYIKASKGNIMRSFENNGYTNIDSLEYNELYYRLLCAAYDRNTRFIEVRQLQDEGFSVDENAIRTQNSINEFSNKMEKLNFKKDEIYNYTDYKQNELLICIIIIIFIIMMSKIMIEIIFSKKYNFIFYLFLTLIGIITTKILPEKFLIYYPTLFAILAPCFNITIVQYFIKENKDKNNFIKLLISTLFLTLLLFGISGIIMSVILSGAPYYLSEKFFIGVKLTLIVPILFTIILCIIEEIKIKSLNCLKDNSKNISLKQIRNKVRKIITKIHWYHILIILILFVVFAIYIKRSGPTTSISYTEIYFRNYLLDLLAARPRTKEIIVGWPCLALYIYHSKYNIFKMFKYIFAIGASILFASVINTFCHVFTMSETMFLRTIYGFVLGIVVSLFAFLLNSIMIKIIKLLKK